MDINRKIVKKSWDQEYVGLKAHPPSKIGLGNYRIARNLGPRDVNDKTTTGNRRFVSDSSDYIKYKSQFASHKKWKAQKGVSIANLPEFKINKDFKVIAENTSLAIGSMGTLYALEENGWNSVKTGSSRDLDVYSGQAATAISDYNGEMTFNNVKIPSDRVIKIEVAGGISSTLEEVGGDIVRPSDNAFTDDMNSIPVKRLISSDDIGSEKIVVNNITDVVAEVAEKKEFKETTSDSVSSNTIKSKGKTTKETINDSEKIVAETIDISKSKINLSTRDDPENTGDTLQKSKEIKLLLDTTTVMDISYDAYGYNSKEGLRSISKKVKEGFANTLIDSDNSGQHFKFLNASGGDYSVDDFIENVYTDMNVNDKANKKDAINTLLEDSDIENIKTDIERNASTDSKNASRTEEYESYNATILNAKARVKKARQTNENGDISGAQANITNNTGLGNLDASMNKIMTKKGNDEFTFLKKKT